MFLKTLLKEERYRIVADQRDGLYLLLVDTNDLGRGSPFTPLWVRQIGDQRSMDALSHWLHLRRGEWQVWGELARRVGYAAFNEHISEVLAAQPAEEVLAPFLTFTADPREIVLGEQVQGPSGLRNDVLYRHRFPSKTAGWRFRSWFMTGRNSDYLKAIIDTGFASGTKEVARVLDSLSRLPEATLVPR